jgi:hypothetical protein
MDKRIGTRSETGTQYPEMTLSGRAYSRPPHSTLNIGGGYFVVLDDFTPPGLDIGAEVETLKASITPVARKGAAVEPTKPSE